MKLKSIIIVAVVVVVILALGLGFGINAKNALDNTETTPFLSEWMSYIKDDVLVKNTVMPGSHDAGTKDMMWMAETQNRTVAEQLKSGSRYFDLRAWQKGNEYYIFHGPIKGMGFGSIIDEIAAFLTAHPTEFVVIDMQKFKGDSQNGVIDILSTKLGDKIVKNNTSNSDIEFVNSLTVGEMRGKCIVFWGDKKTVNNADFLFLRDDDKGTIEESTLSSFYFRKYNTLASPSYIKKGVAKYLEMHKEKPQGLFVLQCQLTDPIFVLGPKAIEALHNGNMSDYIKHLDIVNNKINIVMRDYIGPKKCAEIIFLNLGYDSVKSTLVNAFSNELIKLF